MAELLGGLISSQQNANTRMINPIILEAYDYLNSGWVSSANPWMCHLLKPYYKGSAPRSNRNYYNISIYPDVAKIVINFRSTRPHNFKRLVDSTVSSNHTHRKWFNLAVLSIYDPDPDWYPLCFKKDNKILPLNQLFQIVKDSAVEASTNFITFKEFRQIF